MAGSVRPILLIEDSDEDFDVTASALRLAGVTQPILRCANSHDALDYIHQRQAYTAAPRPLLVLLDLNLPGLDGRRLLRELHGAEWLATVPVIVLTTSTNPRDVDLCYRQGASGYLVKPVDLEKFERMIQHVVDYWLRTVQLAPENGGLQWAHGD